MSGIDGQRWASMTLAEQMANIGSEVGRSGKWLAKNKPVQAESAFLRALDLIDLTIKYGRAGRPDRSCLLKELCRARDCYTESFLSGDADTLSFLDKYFGRFAAICRHDLVQ